MDFRIARIDPSPAGSIIETCEIVLGLQGKITYYILAPWTSKIIDFADLPYLFRYFPIGPYFIGPP